MPSFDIVSEVDRHELTNAVDQANRELERRFDFKGVDAAFELSDQNCNLHAPSEFQLEQMMGILESKLASRGIDARSMELGDVETNVSQARRTITFKQGIGKEDAKSVVARIKDSKLKVKAQINGEKLRVEGKKRDDLQAVMAMLKKDDSLKLPLQFDNFRD